MAEQENCPENSIKQPRLSWRKHWKRITAVCGVLAAAVGFLSSLETFRPLLVSWFDTARELRLQGADCRAEGYVQLRSGSWSTAKASFGCATELFEIAGEKGDALGWYGIALLYGDSSLTELLPETGTGDDFFVYADVMWCRARAGGASVANHVPPHRSSDPC